MLERVERAIRLTEELQQYFDESESLTGSCALVAAVASIPQIIPQSIPTPESLYRSDTIFRERRNTNNSKS